MRQRNAAGLHPFAPNEADFDLILKHFAPPAADEDFNVKVYGERG